MGKVKYILLDCDNTLCQSERLAFEACADLTNQLMKEKKIDAHYTLESLLEDFVGFNFRGMLKGLQKKHNFSMTPDEEEDYVGRELGAVTAKLKEKAVECPGVTPQLENLKKEGYPMSVVSTSAKPRVVASLEKCNLDRFFPNEHVYSAATSMPKPSSKPDPAIYLYACEKLGVKPSETVTVEDSKSGATAALRAGIPLIAYVGIYGLEEGKEKEAQMAKALSELPQTLAEDLKERNVTAKTPLVMYDWKEFPELLKKIEAQN